MKVAIVGAGYVGLVSGLVHWERGHDVLFVEPDDTRRDGLVRGRAPFHEPGVDALLDRANASGRVRFESNFDGVAEMDVALVCVPTPVAADARTDSTALSSVACDLRRVLAHSTSLQAVFVRSTCVPGTTRSIFGTTILDAPSVGVGVMPEFLREGTALDDQRAPDRIVVGAESDTLRSLARRLHAGIDVPFVETTLESAELLKLANNAFLATCISLANEIACVAERVPGIDADVVFGGVHLDRRLRGSGRAAIVDYLKPGAGFGGSCLGKDARALATFARDHGEEPHLLDAVLAVNDAQPTRLVGRLEAEAGGLRGRCVLVLGLAFKPGTDDSRNTVARPIVSALVALGATVLIHDPMAVDTFVRSLPDDERSSVDAVEDWRAALDRADALVLVTAWPEYGRDLANALASRHRPLIVADGRSMLRGATLPSLVRYVAVGLGPSVAHGPDSSVESGTPRNE